MLIGHASAGQPPVCGVHRYWASIGPQEAQYIPGPLLREGENELILLETEASPADATGMPATLPIGRLKDTWHGAAWCWMPAHPLSCAMRAGGLVHRTQRAACLQARLWLTPLGGPAVRLTGEANFYGPSYSGALQQRPQAPLYDRSVYMPGASHATLFSQPIGAVSAQ